MIQKKITDFENMKGISKRCVRCNQIKHLEAFHRSSCSKDGRYNYCKECVKIMNIGRRRIHPYTLLRRSILDKTGGRCYLCGSNQKTNIHHIIPRTMGGKDDTENLIPLCRDCHAKAHNGSFGYGKLNMELLAKFQEFVIETSNGA